MTKKDKGTVSPAEQRILDVLWRGSPKNAREIIAAVSTVESWSGQTIKTLINRLVKKKYIGFHQEKNHYLYFPLITEQDYQLVQSQSFIQRIFGGRISPLVTHFVKQQKLSADDVKDLKKILQELDGND